jgi:hypothetical protein
MNAVKDSLYLAVFKLDVDKEVSVAESGVHATGYDG